MVFIELQREMKRMRGSTKTLDLETSNYDDDIFFLLLCIYCYSR